MGRGWGYRWGRRPAGDRRASGAPGRGWSLRHSVLLPGVVLLFGAVLVIGPVSFRLVSDHLTAMAQVRAGEVLDSLLVRLDDNRQDRARVTAILATDPALAEALQNGDVERLRSLLIRQRASFGLDDVMVITENGEVLVSLNQKSPVIAAAATLPLVHRVFVEGPVSEVRVLSYGLSVSAGTTFGSGPRRAALVLSRVMGDEELAEIKARERVEVAAFRGDIVAAASLPGPERGTLAAAMLNPVQPAPPAGLLGIPWHLLPGREQTSTLTMHGTSYTATWSAVPGGRILALVENADLIMARDMIGRFILITSLIALVVIFLFSLLVRAALIRPLQRIIQITSAMAAGDFGQQAPPTFVRELSQLSRAVNFMAERIRARITLAEAAASTDFLTGLYNHRYFQEALANALAAAGAGGPPCALLMMDLDHFKLYNDSLGHQAGDDLLRRIAQDIRRHVRPTDVPCRYGGDEFAIVLPGADAATAADVSRRIRQSVAAHRLNPGTGQGGTRVTISVGIAVAPDHARSKEEMIKFADDAMYRAKHQSRPLPSRSAT